ncbi:hypothetical protein DsansV1_C29g0209581 [Dioscorea sansibarensis]
MAYGKREPSIFDSFTLSPLPYPVIFILAMVLLLLGISGFFTYESIMEDAEEQINWVLFIIPVVLLLLIRWLSSFESFEGLFGFLPYDYRRRSYFAGYQEGSSPWGVLAIVVLLLVLVSFQSDFRDMWSAIWRVLLV